MRYHCQFCGKSVTSELPDDAVIRSLLVCPECIELGRIKIPAVTALTVNISEIRKGEDNDGPLESTDLFIQGRGISLLMNVLAGEHFTYSLGVDGEHQQSGVVGEETGVNEDESE